MALVSVPWISFAYSGTHGSLLPTHPPAPSGNRQVLVGPGPMGTSPTSPVVGAYFLGNLSVGSQPTDVVFDHRHGWLYVTNFGTPPPQGLGNTVTIVNGSTDVPIATIGVGDDPLRELYDPNNGYVYVVDYGFGNNVTVIDGTSTIASIPVGHNPDDVEYDPANGYVYVTNYGSSNLTVIDNLTVIANLPIGTYPESSVYDAANGYMYAANYGSGNLSVVDGTTLVGSVGVGSLPTFMAYDAGHGTVYVANSGSGNVSIVKDTGVVATVATSGSPNSVTYDSVDGYVYVPNVGTNTVYVLSNTKIVANISVGQSPRFAAFDAANGQVYVSSWTTGNVSVLNGTELRAAVTVGSEPYTVKYDPDNEEVYTPVYGYVNSSGNSNLSAIGAAPSGPTVTVREVGLPSGANWSIAVPPSLFYATTNSTAFRLPNGTYPYWVPRVPGYEAENGTGNLTVNGSALTLIITFRWLYSITFTEQGLPAGTNWSVTVESTRNQTSQTQLGFERVNGSYTYTIGYVAGYHPSTPAGRIDVNGSNVRLTVGFVETLYTLDFVSTGLPSGSSWTVDLGGVGRSSSNGTIAFAVPNGTYTFQVPPVAGYYTPNSTGRTMVAGSDVSVPISFATAFAVTFLESGLPAGTAWNVTVGGLIGASTSTAITVELANGTFDYRIGPQPGFVTNWTGSVTVVGGTITVAVGFVPMRYPIQFVATGLPTGTAWTVTVDAGSHSSSASEIIVLVSNGTHTFTVDPVAGYFLAPGQGSVTISGEGSTVNVTFQRLFVVQFAESGLPAGQSWSVVLGNLSNSSTGSTLTFSVPNGTYPYRVVALAGFTSSPVAAELLVQGGPKSVSVTFTAVTYPVLFHASGLPAGTAWNLTVDGRTTADIGGTVSLQLPNGTFAYTVGAIPGFTALNRSGTFTVAGSIVDRTLYFERTVYTVEFVTSGLPAGASWSVDIAGITPTATAPNSLTIALPNGSYPYSVVPPTGFVGPGPSSVVVTGASPAPITLPFTRAVTGGQLLGGGAVAVLALVAAAAAAIGILVAVLWIRRRRSMPGGGPPMDDAPSDLEGSDLPEDVDATSDPEPPPEPPP